MSARSSGIAFVLVVAALVLSGSRCGLDERAELVCPLVCDEGFKRDVEGRTYCECLEPGGCALTLSLPHRDPATDRCVIFPTPCDVPRGWEPCGPGCEVGTGFILVSETIQAPDGCNTCTCVSERVLACTEMACSACSYEGEVHPVGDTFPAGDGCNTCYCRDDGRVVCTLRPCPICLPPEPRKLCERTGGIWDPNSCGHYRCGEFPFCDAIIPGCDCGKGRSFQEGTGCVEDPACGACGPERRCPPGSVCDPCPAHPTCRSCGCGPPVCEPLSCSFDEDCPAGSRCEGSSVCPPDVVCVWEGRPGVCVPTDGCCDPGARPGVRDNPICFEGASCCADGRWACNRGDGSSSCDVPGVVCPAPERPARF
jgi:hypothetical protein